MILAAVFYLFAFILLLSGFLVITARNPVHSVLFLILAFFNAAGLFVLLGAEFIAMILVIVYVGAVAVLFLFVVMMLDIDFAHLRKGAMQYVPLGLLVGVILLTELVISVSAWQFNSLSQQNLAVPEIGLNAATNTQALGAVLYTQYVYAFQLAGLILLVAMIGAIVLTHRVRPGVRKQSIESQNARRPEEAMEILKVQSGAGIS
ncbi:MAG: NADH-quinone oxidoreductase subunit J [Alphaproteobacteria bacterium]|nr:NADH-quinone oxidoreductase subunit J [Alphaproteobacteria bacterium]